MADLITLTEVKERMGIDPTDTREDTALTHVIGSASQAVINYTERDFGSANVVEERPFQYDGSGWLDIDDAAAITAVAMVVPGTTDLALTTNEYIPQPARRDDAPVYTYLLLPGIGGVAVSPEMGFERNLDVYAAEGRLRTVPATVKVTAQWGWPVVPEDVQQAVLWTIQEFLPRRRGADSERLQAEAIAGHSRSWRAGGDPLIAIPNRAKDLLQAYARLNV